MASDCIERIDGGCRRTRLALSASFAIPILLGTTVCYFAVRDQPKVVKLALLAFTAGILATVAVEEIVPRHARTVKLEQPLCLWKGSRYTRSGRSRPSVR